LLKKIGSDRIYGTLFYPNALAGAILLLLPACLEQMWKTGWPKAGQVFACGGFTLLAFACLLWSGSKAGWLIALVLGVTALFHLDLSGRVKALIVSVLILGGLAGFWLRYQGYFNRGATSVSARFDYWDVAWRTLNSKPVLGTGPGTFFVTYRSSKRPEAEMTRLAHNDYLQQGSDSGWVGFLAFGVWIWGSLAVLYRRRSTGGGLRLGIWLGLMGMAIQSVVEFGLYIPALAWPTFFLLGTLLGVPPWGEGNPIDKGKAAS
jgi:O-antigen ligase